MWATIVFGKLLENQQPFDIIVKALPGYLLMAFGCYSLSSIGYDLWILKEFPEDHQSLLEDITKSKEFYKSKGVRFD